MVKNKMDNMSAGGAVQASALRWALLGSPLILALGTLPAAAACVTAGLTTTCDATPLNPWPTRIGDGPLEPDNRVVEVGAGASIVLGDETAISLRDGANIHVAGGATVSSTATGYGGLYVTGGNTIEFRSGGTLTIDVGGSVLALGSQTQGEAINLQGANNLIVNNGLILATNSAAIWIQDSVGLNTIINNATGIIQAPGNVIGASGLAAIDFTNRGQVIGNLVFADGDDILRIHGGSSITGTVSGGGGHDRVFLSGDGTASMPASFPGFEELTKTDAGTWTLTTAIADVGIVTVAQGTLILDGDNSAYAGTMIVNAAGTLQGTALSLTPVIADNGLVRFAQPTDATYTGLITGTGWVEKTGAGVLVLAPAAPGGNTYAGGTTLTGGVLAIAADSAIGAPTAAIVFNGGTLRFDAGFDVAATRPISILAPGGTIDTSGQTATIASGITGVGGLTVAGGGALILTGANTYTGGTSIAAATRLQIGAGGSGGSITGDVANAGTLAFNRGNTLVFAGAISGTGEVHQDGPGATVLTGANTYSGATRVNAGILRAGATGVFSPASTVSVAPGGELDLAGFNQTVAGLTNAGLVALRGAPGTTLTVAGNYLGQGGALALNTTLGGDGSATDRLVVSGGSATGDTRLRVTNIGGSGAQTVEGIRVVQAANGGTTAAGAFRLDTRVAAGAYEYLLFRGGSSAGSGDDWFLRSTTTDAVPLYRPEVALYAPVPAIARQMGLATLATLHERVGEEENIRDLTGSSPYANGAWARAFGERTRNRWDGTVDAAATANLVGLQAGFDILRTQPYADGHRDHAGVYVAYTDYNAPSVSGFALGQQGQRVGRLLMSGPAIGAYWTHFGPSGWYVDAVVQANWFDVKASADAGTRMSTSGTGYAASLEAGYPIRFGQGWQIEPQAQIIWQGVSVDRARDAFSSIDWDEGDAVTGRIGARVQYTARTPEALWQPYAKVNLWHAFSGTDRVRLDASPAIDNRYGDTALEVGGGITARVSQTTSFYAHADYRWSLDGGRNRQTATQGSIGIRVNW